jgi:NitT/TauT family transport system substrate-binding protein
MWMGVIAEDSVAMSHPSRQRQRDVLIKGYNMACDSLNRYGVKHYTDVIRKYYKLSEQALQQLPDTLKFDHVAAPRQKDIDRAKRWVKH